MNLFLSKAERIQYLGFDDRLAVLLGIFPIAALANTSFGGWSSNFPFSDMLACYGMAIVFTVIYWLGCRFVILRLRMLYPGEGQVVWRVALAMLISLILVASVATLSNPVVKLLGIREPPVDPPLLLKVVLSYTIVLMVMAIYEGIFFFVQYRRTLLAKERLAKKNFQAQLAVLKQQMNPHFLFNSLNTLVNIIPEDGPKATVFTQRLAAVYRRILEYRHQETIPLCEEINALRDYIFLMQTRFEDKLRINWALPPVPGKEGEAALGELPPDLLHCRIVPLSAQLLVENALKHNVVSFDSPLEILLTITPDSLTVSNQRSRRKDTSAQTSIGWGQNNLRQRYAAITDRPVEIVETETCYKVTVPLLKAPSLQSSPNPRLQSSPPVLA